jgi:predicted transcriptional regulator
MPDQPSEGRMPLLSMRLDPATRDRLDELTEHLGLTRTSVIRLALQRLHQAEGLARTERKGGAERGQDAAAA